jgi:hypothetical protein
LANPKARPPTRSELYKRAQELGVERPSRMNKAALAEAVARKETERLVGTEVWATAHRGVQEAAQQVQDAVRTTVEQEVQSAMKEVQGAVRSAAQAAARQVRETVSEVGQREVQSAAQEVRRAARAAADQEVQAAEQGMQEATAAAVEDSRQTPVQAGRAARGRASPGFGRILRRANADSGGVSAGVSSRAVTVLITIFTAIITATATEIVANDYYTSRIGDWAFRRGALPVSTEVVLERESRVQGLTWVFREGLDLDNLGIHAQLVLGQAATSPIEFNDWARGQGGIDVDISFIELTVTGNRQAGVTITGMQAKVDKREPPLRGAFFYAPPEGERENAQVGFDLDEAVPVARTVEPNKNIGERGYLGGDYFMDKSVHLALGEDQVFNVVAMTTSYYYVWHIEMEVNAGGQTKYIRVDLRRDEKDPPFPFQISARADSRDSKKGNFAVYKQLYVLDKSANRAGFIPSDPQTYAP